MSNPTNVPGTPVKPWWMSKLIWLGIIEITISILQMAQMTDWSDKAAWMTFAMGVLTILARWLTDEPITSPVKELDRFRKGLVKPNKDRSHPRSTYTNHRL